MMTGKQESLNLQLALKEIIKSELIYWEYSAEFGIGVSLLIQAQIISLFSKSGNSH